MAETIGSIVDKITIIDLKIFHMHEQLKRSDIPRAHAVSCGQRLTVLETQKNDLCRELDKLVQDAVQGRKKIKIYRQYKMYNDPAYKTSSGKAS
ncbi:MAG: DUF4254 domain-containing protein [bacterium]